VRAAAVLAVLVLTGCGGGGHAPAPSPTASAAPAATPAAPSDEEAIAGMLDRRAAALQSADRRAYVATGGDRVAVARARRLRLRDVEIEPGRIDVHGARAEALVAVRYGIAGVRGTFQSTHRFDFVKRGRWRAATVHGRRGRPPWDVATFAEHRTRHFVVLAPPDVPVDDLLAALEDGYAALRARLEGGRLQRRYLVIAAADPAQARALTTQIRGLDTLAAIADAALDEKGPAQAVSAVISLRLVVVWSAYATLGAEGRRRTIAHELTHAALAGSTSGRTPAWLVEGVAMYVSGDRRPAPPHPDLAALSRPSSIARLSGDAQADAYGASSAAAFAIVERFGADRLLDLYDAFNDASLRGQPGPRLVNRALRRELGIGLSQLP
jgi:hypothetical protein